MLFAKDRGSFRSGCSQLTKPSNSLPTVAGRPCQGAVYGWRYVFPNTGGKGSRARPDQPDPPVRGLAGPRLAV